MRYRKHKINIRFNNEELKALNEKVALTKMTREDYCRNVLANTPVIEAPNADFYTLITQVKRVGSSLNEILKKANIFGFLDAPQLRNALEQNYQVEKMLWDTFGGSR